MNRKLFVFIVALTTTFFIVPLFASAQVVFIKPSQITEPQVGENIKITVQVKDIKDLSGIQFDLLFDPTALKNDVEETKQGNFPDTKKHQVFFFSPKLQDGKLKDTVLTVLGIGKGADCEVGAECILAYFRFEVLELRASEIKLDAIKVLSTKVDNAGNPVNINVTLEHCSITAGTTSIHPAGKLPITWGRIKQLR